MVTVAIDGILLLKQWDSFREAIAYLDSLNLGDSNIVLMNVQTGSSHVFNGRDFK